MTEKASDLLVIFFSQSPYSQENGYEHLSLWERGLQNPTAPGCFHQMLLDF